ncbi:MAG: hypothetical protein AB7G11_04455 [Phycisphaerales bacterium]
MFTRVTQPGGLPLESMTFSALVPQGFQFQAMGPMGPFAVLPPGATPPPATPACVMVEPVPPMAVPMLMMALRSMDNPFAAVMQGFSVGLSQITSIAPARQTQIGGATAHVREIEGVSMASGQPLRGSLMLLCGMRGVAKVIMFINLFRVPEFIGDCLKFIGGINVNGFGAMPMPSVQAVVDKDRLDQIEFRVRGEGGGWSPITAMPTRVGEQVVLRVEYHHHDHSFHVGNISGVGHAIGHHSVSKVGA